MNMMKLLRVSVSLAITGVLVVAAAFAFGARPARALSLFNVTFSGAPADVKWNDTYASAGRYEVPADGITGVSVNWVSGKAIIEASDGDAIRIGEAFADGRTIDEGEALSYGIDDGILYITFTKQAQITMQGEKVLTLSLPTALFTGLETFSFDSASADLSVSGLHAATFGYKNVSGGLNADAIDAQSANLSATSGDIRFRGTYSALSASNVSGVCDIVSLGKPATTRVSSTSGDAILSGDCGALTVSTISGRVESPDGAAANTVNLNTTSGDLSLKLTSCPTKADISSVSGEVRVSLPKDSAFALKMNSVSGDVDCGFPVLMEKDGRYTVNGGGAEIRVNTTSGDLTILAE